MSVRSDARIVGVYEMPSTELTGYRDPVSANAVSIRRAARDGDVEVRDIDVILTYDSLVAPDILQANRVAEYLGIKASVAATVGAAGASPLTALAMADALLETGAARTVAIAHSDLRSLAGRERVMAIMAANVGNLEFEAAFGPIIPTMYSLIADWLVSSGMATAVDFADIAVATRAWAALNPNAAQTSPLTRDQVLEAPRVAGLFGKYDCCLVTDFSGAVIVTAAAGSQQAARVRAVQSSNSHEELSQIDVNEPMSAVESTASKVYEAAGVGPADIRAAFLYDCFTSAVAQQLIAYGLTGGRPLSTLLTEFGIGPDGTRPVNTHGGLLSATTSGLFHLIEAVRQLRGSAGARQIERLGPVLVTNLGGLFSTHSAVVLEGVS